MSSEGTRITLIHCMRKLLRERPIDRISIGDICESAHIGRRTFYRYFSDKYNLMTEVIFHYMKSRLDVAESDTQWDVVEKCCRLLYEERTLFVHAYKSRGQNGFWEDAVKFVQPYAEKEYPSSGYLHDRSIALIPSSIHIMMHLTEKWLKDGCPTDPETFCRESRHTFAIFSKWLYQSAMNKEIEAASEEQLLDGTW